jgi:hypothetical protein
MSWQRQKKIAAAGGNQQKTDGEQEVDADGEQEATADDNKKLLQMETWMWWRSSKNVILTARKECLTLKKKQL